MKEDCDCFGYTGHQSTTHVDGKGVERCDLCGMPCMHRIDGIDPTTGRMAFGILVASTVLAGVAMVRATRHETRLRRRGGCA